MGCWTETPENFGHVCFGNIVCIIQPQSTLPDVKEAAEIKLGVPSMLDKLL